MSIYSPGRYDYSLVSASEVTYYIEGPFVWEDAFVVGLSQFRRRKYQERGKSRLYCLHLVAYCDGFRLMMVMEE